MIQMAYSLDGNVMGIFIGRSICPPDTDCLSIANNAEPSHPSNSLVNSVHLKGLGNYQACNVVMKDKAIIATPAPQSVRPGVTYSEWHHTVHKALKEEKVSQIDTTGNKYLGPRLLGN